MKNARKLFALLCFTTLFFSCTPNGIDEDHSNQTVETYGTGDDQSDDMDEDRDDG
jgi:hypothetical protein